MEKKLICIFVGMLMFAPFVSAVAKQESIVTKSVNSLENSISMDNVNLMETFSIGRKTAYACAMTEITPGFYQFDLNNPGQMTLISALIGEPYAGTWANNTWYIITYPNNYLYKVDPENGTIVFIGSTSVSTSLIVTGMAYDDSSGKMFGCWVDLIPNNVIFYQINLTTGLATQPKILLNHRFIDIACNSSGKFYSPDVIEDNLYLVDPTVPSATLIGSLGIFIDYAQGAEFDKDTDILYLAAYTTYGSLYTCNTTTGQATFIGNFSSGADVDALAIPYGLNTPPETPPAPTGPSSGVVGVSYDFIAQTTDPETDDIYYWFDWDDGTNSGWLGPFASGTPATASKAWAAAGSYNVTVKAKDALGAESGFSDPLTVSIVEGPILEIGNFTGGLFKIKATVKNIGGGTANSIKWTIKLTGGLILLGKETTGNILALNAGDEREITSNTIIGLGKTVVTVSAECAESSATKDQDATVLLFFIKI